MVQNVCVNIKLKSDGWSIEWFDTDSGERWLIERGYASRFEAVTALRDQLDIEDWRELRRSAHQ